MCLYSKLYNEIIERYEYVVIECCIGSEIGKFEY